MIRIISGIAVAVIVTATAGAAFASDGAFNPTSAPAGHSVTISGNALPNSSMSAYFYCDAGCGETHVGATGADANGRYSLSFTIPAGAKAGAATVAIGCDTCGNGWIWVKGLLVTPAPEAAPPPAAAPTPSPAPDVTHPHDRTRPQNPGGTGLRLRLDGNTSMEATGSTVTTTAVGGANKACTSIGSIGGKGCGTSAPAGTDNDGEGNGGQ